MKSYECVVLNEEASIGQARRAFRRCAAEIGFNERQMAEIEIAVKEVGSNAIKFARSTGQIYCSETDERLDLRGLEIVYVDKGPGIEDTALAIEDGYTTSGSMGAGLGAVKRMVDEFYIYSMAPSSTRRLSLYGRTNHGTAIVLRKYIDQIEGQPAVRQSRWGAFTRPQVGQESNGDGYVIKSSEDRHLVAIIDGLGHGEGARDATAAAIEVIEESWEAPVEVILRAAHEALRPTRGAVMGLAAIDYANRTVEYTGIGNTDFRVLGGAKPLRFISLNGTLGSRLERVKVFKEQLPRSATMVLTTDGVSDRWDPENYPGLIGLDPQLFCGVIMRDYGRTNDDATILCGRLTF
ncbi:MAG TPA: ATP-binding protein [Blastocatellia bacterium]|nr:ATP-binding protein [Blastocatellia bacterium]